MNIERVYETQTNVHFYYMQMDASTVKWTKIVLRYTKAMIFWSNAYK